jgi:hypothetical protein
MPCGFPSYSNARLRAVLLLTPVPVIRWGSTSFLLMGALSVASGCRLMVSFDWTLPSFKPLAVRWSGCRCPLSYVAVSGCPLLVGLQSRCMAGSMYSPICKKHDVYILFLIAGLGSMPASDRSILGRLERLHDHLVCNKGSSIGGKRPQQTWPNPTVQPTNTLILPDAASTVPWTDVLLMPILLSL